LETQPTSGGCWSVLVMIAVALFGGFGFLAARSAVVDVPPTPSEAVILQFSAEATADDQQLTVDIITQRLTALGMRPVVQLNPSSDGDPATIRVLLPGGDDFQATLDLIRQAGDFELVDLSGLNPSDYQDALIWTTHQAEVGALRAADAQQHPETNQPFTTVLDNTHLMKAEVVVDGELGTWTIDAIFDQEGGGILGVFTAAHVGEPLAIVVDGRVLSAPVIQAMISGEAVIQGNFTLTEARQLAAKISFGALPVPLELVSIG